MNNIVVLRFCQLRTLALVDKQHESKQSKNKQEAMAVAREQLAELNPKTSYLHSWIILIL